VISFISAIGNRTINILSEFGAAMILLWRIFLNGRFIIADRKLYFRQMVVIGVESLPLVLLIGAFTGAVTTWQSNYQFGDLVPAKYIGVATFKAVVVELGPVLSGLVLAGRVGSSLAAELGTMRISEQVDALTVFSIDPIRYLAAPRFFSGFVMFPIIITIGVFVAVIGGFAVGNIFMDLSAQTYFGEIPVWFKMQDLRIMLVKSITFGGIVCLIGTQVGLSTSGGAEGVGQATIKAFVNAAVLILISDYMLALILF
jgi:phospholipid/cholesterol/gamma-HCH transport system permease protein